MTNIDYPWEPPLAGTEADHLIGALDRLRTTFRWKADDLDADGLQTRIGVASLTLGGLLKHLAICEDYKFTTKLAGEPLGGPWAGLGWDGSDDEWEFTTARDDSPALLYALWDDAVERSRVGSARPWRRAGVTSSSTTPGPTAPMPACAALCAT
jgi:hypothetical protein